MLKERVLTALILAPLAIAGVLLLSTKTLAACVGAIFIVAAMEWGRLIGLRTPEGRLAYVTIFALLMGLAWQFRALGTLEATLAIGAIWWLVTPLWLRNFDFANTERRRHVWIKAVAGVLAVVPAFAALILLHRGERGPEWLLYLLFLIWVADVSAYFAGRRFGGAKLAPRISPGKTWAGAYGALAGATVLAVVWGWSLEPTWLLRAELVLLALLTVVFSIVGDLFESLIKRHSNAKDSGAILPGHGGIFDRFDSLFAALPVFTAGRLLLNL